MTYYATREGFLRPPWCCSGSGTMRVQQSCRRRRRPVAGHGQGRARLSACHLTVALRLRPKQSIWVRVGSQLPVNFV